MLAHVRRSRLVPLAIGVMLGVGCQQPRAVVTGRELLHAREQYGEQPIVLLGTVMNPRKRIPEVGDVHTELLLADGTAQVPVIAWGTQDVASGDLVEVRGTFHDLMTIGNEVRRGVVEAKFVRVMRAAPQPRGTPGGPP